MKKKDSAGARGLCSWRTYFRSSLFPFDSLDQLINTGNLTFTPYLAHAPFTIELGYLEHGPDGSTTATCVLVILLIPHSNLTLTLS